MSDLNLPNYTHRVYNNNPINFKNYVNKQVTITTDGSSVHNGILYTIDPVSESIILVEPCEDNKFKASIIMGHCVKNMQISSSTELNLPDFFPRKQAQYITESDLSDRREKIKKLLMKHQLPVVDNNGTLEVEGMFSIQPPYDIENCDCDNSLVLSRIRQILYESNDVK